MATSLLMEPGLSPEAPCPSHLRVDQLFEALASSRPSRWARLSALSKGSTRVYVLSCARPRAELTSRTIPVGCWKDEPLGAQPLTSEAKENLRSLVLKGPFDKPSFEFFQVP